MRVLAAAALIVAVTADNHEDTTDEVEEVVEEVVDAVEDVVEATDADVEDVVEEIEDIVEDVVEDVDADVEDVVEAVEEAVEDMEPPTEEEVAEMIEELNEVEEEMAVDPNAVGAEIAAEVSEHHEEGVSPGAVEAILEADKEAIMQGNLDHLTEIIAGAWAAQETDFSHVQEDLMHALAELGVDHEIHSMAVDAAVTGGVVDAIAHAISELDADTETGVVVEAVKQAVVADISAAQALIAEHAGGEGAPGELTGDAETPEDGSPAAILAIGAATLAWL